MAALFRYSPLLGVVVATAGCGAILGIPDDVVPSAPPTVALDGVEPDVTRRVLEAGTPDTAMRTDATSDESSRTVCDITKDFAAPVALMSVSTAEDDGAARLSEDELTIYLDGVRAVNGPSSDIFYAERAALTDSFGPVKKFPSIDDSIDSADDEYAPNVTDDGLSLVFERRNIATSNSDIFTATRASKQDSFGSAFSVPQLNTSDYEANVFIRGTTEELWHVRKVPSQDIFVATLTERDGYVATKPANVSSDTYIEKSPVISKDGLTLYFQSNRPINAGRVDTNIWVSTRPTRTAAFSAPVVVTNVNSEQSDYPGFISADGCRLYLVSARPGIGQKDIYVATRPK